MTDLTKTFLTDMITRITDSIGFGYPESIYQKAVDYELRNYLFKVQQEVNIDIVYGLVYCGSIRADLIVDDKYIIELKTVDKLKPKHKSQIIRYLKTMKLTKGFLINISYDSFEIEEIEIQD